MEIAFILAAIILFHITIVSLQLWNGNQRLLHNPHVQPLAIALPVQGILIQQLINDMAKIAEIHPPEVFVYRACLPNAYIASMPLRPELFLSDEALEQASESNSPIEYMAQLIGHEMAHIRLHHALFHAPIMYLAQSRFFLFFPMRTICQVALKKIEASADNDGARIARLYLKVKQ
ncbi:MAG: M48 family metalloprotease [Mariprofundaceae bacterium]